MNHLDRPSAQAGKNGQVRRVLMVSHALNVAGAAVHMRTLGQQLIARDIQVAIAARDLNPGATRGREWFAQAGFKTFQVDFPGVGASLHNLRQLLVAVPAFHRLLKTYQPDVVHIHALTLCLVARWPCRQQHLPIVTTFHLWPDGKRKQQIARWSNRLMSAPLGDRTIAISSEMYDRLTGRLGLPIDRTRLIPHGVDTAYFHPPTSEQRLAARSALGVNFDQFVISMLAVLDPRKNHELLFRALVKLKNRGIPAVALCAGEGSDEYAAKLRRQITTLGIDEHVRLLGTQESRQVYWASDVSVLPSRYEGFGLVIAEAMLTGAVPLRTPAEGTHDQIRDGENGFVIPFDDPDVLADRLTKLATDPSLQQKMSHNAIAFAREHFSVDRMVEQTIATYQEAIAEVRAKRP